MKLLTVVSLGLLAALALPGQRQRISPHEQVSATVNGKKITVEYGRPYLKDRKAVGGALVPYNQVWRTGADEATKLTTEADLDIGGQKVPKGSYSLFTLPGEKEWKLIVNKVADQWGAFNYKEADDLGRFPMTLRTLPQKVEQFTIALEPAGDNKLTLRLTWETVEATIPILVM